MKTKISLLLCFLSITMLLHAQLLPPPDGNTRDFAPGEYPPGYVNPADWAQTCFSYMGAVEFTSNYRFKSLEINGALPTSYGFSIPLVGDLNGDGYPEIVAIRSNGYSDLYAKYDGILIYNGQTGKLISNLQFPWLAAGAYHYQEGHHHTPSIMALVDSDRDGTVEAIIATPHLNIGASAATRRNSVISLNLVYNSVTKTYSLTEKWLASNYNAEYTTKLYNDKPIPQVVDFDGDGVPEVLIYNKIYNASTGALLLTMEQLGTTDNDAYIGADLKASFGDLRIGFSYVYDMNFDGTYDVVAGGKVYKITKNGATWKSEAIRMPGIVDGRTGVADINGDGIPDVVAVTRTNATDLNGKVVVTVWNPDLLRKEPDGTIVANTGTPVPYILGNVTLSLGTNGQGNNSYVYIGDIDGREQVVGGKSYRLPEIAILSGRFQYGVTPIHPNAAGLGIPTTGNSMAAPNNTGTNGVIAAVTWDATEGLLSADRLKLSFILGHADRSINTGFTMFDFDNDGLQEICYRDEQTLRIIKATKPYITQNETDPNTILFKQTVKSFTGFEYPVIADIDNDASAEMVVMGGNGVDADDVKGYLFALGSYGDKFAPALPVWNQFMYDPFKINPDLTTPCNLDVNGIPTGTYKAPNRLEMKYNFTRFVRQEDGTIVKVVKEYSPYNGTLIQMPKYQLQSGEDDDGNQYDNIFEPIIFLTEAYLVDEKAADKNKRPKINLATKEIEFYIGNRSTAEIDIATSTPITVYENSIEWDGSRKVYQKTVGELTNSAIKAGEERLVKFVVPDAFKYYIIRIGDASDHTVPSVPVWHFGVNEQKEFVDPGFDNFDKGLGVSKRAYRDCHWKDQTGKVSAFMLFDDPSTVQEYTSIAIDVLDNDILPTGFNIATKGFTIVNQPTAGDLSISGGTITYTHNGKATLDDCIDKFTYQVEFPDPANASNIIKRQADVYIFVLQGASNGFEVCYNASYHIQMRLKPDGVTYIWYADDVTPTVVSPDPTLAPINNVIADIEYYVEPLMPATGIYSSIIFPRGKLLIKVIEDVSNEHRVLQWTGAVNKDWNNRFNWQEVQAGGTLVAATFAPTPCVDVIVPMVTTNYPELSTKSQSSQVVIRGRGMIKNTYLLEYDAARIELNLTADDFGRWISYSSMFDQMFSGDLAIIEYASNYNASKATYLSLYERKTPATNLATPPAVTGDASVAKKYSEPFMGANIEMKLGMPYMFYFDKYYTDPYQLTLPRTTTYRQMTNSPNGTSTTTLGTYSMTRVPAKIGKFAYENYTVDPITGEFSMTMDSYSEYVLIPNPYPAYISVNEFLKANTIFEADQYMIWSGQKTDNFVMRENNKARFWKVNYTATMTPIILTDPDVLIPPFQSFFVKRKNTSGNTITIKYLPKDMSKTLIEVGGYKLR